MYLLLPRAQDLHTGAEISSASHVDVRCKQQVVCNITLVAQPRSWKLISADEHLSSEQQHSVTLAA